MRYKQPLWIFSRVQNFSACLIAVNCLARCFQVSTLLVYCTISVTFHLAAWLCLRISGLNRPTHPIISTYRANSPCNYFSGFLQRVSIACYADRRTSCSKSVRLSVCHTLAMTHATITGSSLEDSPITLVSPWLTSARNSKGNIDAGTPNERGVGKMGNF